MHRLQELVRLHRMGTGAREVARLLGLSPNTERQWRVALGEAGLLAGPVDELPALDVLRGALPAKVPPQQVSSAEGQLEAVQRLLKKGAGPRAIYDRLRLESPDEAPSYWAVKRLCRRLAAAAGPKAADVAIPVETAPGQVAQVDFGYVGRLFDPATQQHRRAWVFVLVLGHSRHLFARIVFDQRIETWLRLHVEAFSVLGGVPEVVVPDNLKAAVVRAAFGLGDEPGLNRSYRELARHYGFKIDPTPARSPEKKGKVEAGVKYVAGNFLATLPEELDADEANRALDRWVVEVAGQRVHGTTQRRPLDVFLAEERDALLPLPARPFVPVTWRKAKVHRDSHVVFDKRLYSVPWRHLGQEVWIRATSSTVDVFADDVRVAQHDRRGPGMRSTIEAHLPSGRADLRHRGREFWEARARTIGPVTAELVSDLFDDSDVLAPLRKVQAVVTLLETLPRERAENTARRALHFGVHDYRGVRDIVRKGLDFEPLPPELFDDLPAAATAPRFTRPVSEMLAGKQEMFDEWN